MLAALRQIGIGIAMLAALAAPVALLAAVGGLIGAATGGTEHAIEVGGAIGQLVGLIPATGLSLLVANSVND